MLTFAEYLRQERLANGLTMQELATRLAVSPQFISLLESGKRHPSDKLVQRCAKVFDEDLNYLRFLAQPIPEAQKRALFESPSAPDYLPQSLRKNVLVQDSDDVLIENLLAASELPNPEEDTPYHFATEVGADVLDLAFQNQLMDRIQRLPERFPLKVQAWAEFYRAYFRRHMEGRVAAQEDFEALYARLRRETTETYPQRLRYLISVHLGLCYHEAGHRARAKELYSEAYECAAATTNASNQACALWLLATAHRDDGDLLSMMECLHKALETPDIPPFAIARCRSEAAEGSLALWENDEVIENAEDTIKLWRSSTLPAPQEQKSLHLIRMEIAAFEANLRLGREQQARNWLSRVRSMRVRVPVPAEDEARIAVLAAKLLASRGRMNQAKGHLRDVLRLDLPETDRIHMLRTVARVDLAEIALREGRPRDAEDLLKEAEAAPPVKGAAREAYRSALIAFAWCAFYQSQGDSERLRERIEREGASLAEAISTDPRLEGTALIDYLLDMVEYWKDQVAS